MSDQRHIEVASIRDEGWKVLIAFPARIWWAVPVVFIGVKILDVYLRRTSDAVWYCYFAEGLFRKLDDVSLAVALAGVSTGTYIAAASFRLSKAWKASAFQRWSLSYADARLWLILVVVSIAAYSYGMYVTDGTFFIELERKKRIAQVVEGMLNVGLICMGHFYGVIGLSTLRQFESKLAQQQIQPPLGEDRIRSAEYLANVTFAFIIGAGGLLVSFMFFQGLVLAADNYLHLGIAKCASLKPSPLSDWGNQVGKLALIAALCFGPYLLFAPRLKRVLPKWVQWRLNLKLKLESLDIDSGSLKPPVKVGFRVPRLVVVTLVEVFEEIQKTTK